MISQNNSDEVVKNSRDHSNRIYRPDWRIAIVFIIGLVFWIVGASLDAYSTEVWIKASLGMTLMIAIVILLSTWFSYVSISGSWLKFVDIFFIRRSVSIDSITEINDQPTYKLAGSQFRSLYIFYKNENKEIKWIELKISIYSEKILGQIIKDLKTINPRIELNAYAEKLMNSTS